MATIADRKPDALLELGNRADIDVGAPSRLDKWFRDSYIELCMNVPLETLEISKDDVWAPTPDGVYPLPNDARFPKCITLNLQGSVVTLDYKDITYIRQMSSQSPGPPSVYTLYGNKAVVRPILDQSYSIIWDYWQLPVIKAAVADTPLLVPLDWLEIVDLGALLRGFKALLERDKAKELQELLYGFKTPTGKAVPGYITYRQTQQQAGSEYENYGLQPRTRKYTG